MARQMTAAGDKLVVSGAGPIDDLASFTWSCWVYPNSSTVGFTSSTPGVLCKLDASGVRQKRLRVTSAITSRRVVADVTRGGTSASTQSVSLMVDIGVWQHLAMTYTESDGIRLYKNGVELSYASRVVGSGATAPDVAGDVWMGATPLEGTLRGSLAEVGIWNRVLTVEEIAHLAVDRWTPATISDGCVGAWRLLGEENPEPPSVGNASAGVVGAVAQDAPVPGIVLVANETLPLFLSGIPATSTGAMPLVVFGALSHRPGDSVCPILDPTAAIQIGDDLIEIYQNRIDALINQLGKDVILEFDPVVTPCINCTLDPISGRSTGVYKAGGPRSFPRGRRCPVCNGQGTTLTPETRCIKALLKWAPKEMRNHGITVSDPHAIVRTKTMLTDAPFIARASTAIVDYGIHDTTRLRVRRLREPVPVGLRVDRYCVAFWQVVEG